MKEGPFWSLPAKFKAGDYVYFKKDKRIVYRILNFKHPLAYYAIIPAGETNDQEWGHIDQGAVEEQYELLGRLEKLVLFGETNEI